MFNDPVFTVTYQGDPRSASLQSITISDNGVYMGEMIAGNWQTPLPIGTKATFSAATPGVANNIDCVGHFIGGATQVIYDSTLPSIPRQQPHHHLQL